jgi:hypothetical protein
VQTNEYHPAQLRGDIHTRIVRLQKGGKDGDSSHDP